MLYLKCEKEVLNGQTEPIVNVQDANFKVGENAVIICDYTLGGGTRTLQAAQWYNSTSTGDQLNLLVNSALTKPNGRYAVDTTQTGVVTLIIANTVLSDDGYYICRIVDSPDVETGENVGKLTVQYLEEPVLNPTELSVNATETVTFTCSNLIGVPTITVTWIKDGNELGVFDTDKYPSSDATLTINDVDEEDEGDYQCRAENAAYSGTDGKLSNTATLSIALTTTSSIPSKSTTRRFCLFALYLL
ncbi:neural cell adhesion molecule 1-like [Antedon mediterranea]|uniref:neural cell adhesion molecule 1-like n=1 Tax=Antedon mediterranea TaxID=105859 RepID=UPI003AF427CD